MINKSNTSEDTKKMNTPEKKNSKKFGNSLSLNQQSLEKHPSAKNLIDSNSQKNEDLNNKFSKVIISQEPDNEISNNEEVENNPLEEEYKNVKISRIEKKPFIANDNYYEINTDENIKNQPKDKKESEKSPTKNMYLFDEKQMEIDKEITKSIKEDAKFEDIQKKFFVLKGSD